MECCRSCGSPLPPPFLNLGNAPLSNAFLSAKAVHSSEQYFPLELYFCPCCTLVQLDEFQVPDNIFSQDYPYFSSYSSIWLTHCREYAEMAIKRFGLDQKSFVLEIGSNDGYLLQYFREKGILVRGVEPAKNTAEIAIANGIPTDIAYFNRDYSRSLAASDRFADLIIGNNVIAQNPNLNDFIEGLRIALSPHGVITMEFPHLLNLLEKNQFDTIYHEHYSYFSLQSIGRLFSSHFLEIFDVEELQTHGGSLRIYAKHAGDHSRVITPRVFEIRDKESEYGLLDYHTYEKFRSKVEAIKRSLLRCLIDIKNQGKMIVGYGAPAKGNTLLNYCGIRSDFLDYTVDINPHKQNLFLPGTHIPVMSPDKILEDRPDFILILPWNIKEEIMEQLSYIREWGGRFIVPIPEVTVTEA